MDRFQVKRKQNDWQDISEAEARRLLGKGYSNVDRAIDLMRQGQYCYTTDGGQIRLLSPDTAPIQSKLINYEEDGEVLWA